MFETLNAKVAHADDVLQIILCHQWEWLKNFYFLTSKQ